MSQASQASPPPAPGRPETLNAENYDYLLGLGYTPEGIAAAMAPYNPASGQSYVDTLLRTLPEPEPPRRNPRAYNMAGLGDALRLLVEGFGASKGAHARAAERKDFLTARQLDRDEALRAQYRAQTDANHARTWQARMAMLADGFNQHTRDRAQINAAIVARQQDLRKKKEFEEQLDYDKTVHKDDVDQKEKDRVSRAEISAASLRQRANESAADYRYRMAQLGLDGEKLKNAKEKAAGEKEEKERANSLYIRGKKALYDGTFTPKTHPHLFKRKYSAEDPNADENGYIYEPIDDKDLIIDAARRQFGDGGGGNNGGGGSVGDSGKPPSRDAAPYGGGYRPYAPGIYGEGRGDGDEKDEEFPPY
jgi:hypothetical protein